MSALRLPFRTPYRWDAVAAFLAGRAIAPLERWSDGTYERRVGRGCLKIETDGDALTMTVPARGDAGDFAARARRMFDLDADPSVIDAQLGRDPLLRRLIATRRGTRVPGAWEPFEVAVRAIVGQQISVRGATTIMNRIADQLTPAKLAETLVDGMPRARAEAIRGLARAVADDPSLLTRGATLEATIERLTSLRGIGPWTAHYIAMRALGEPDAFPHGDLGLRKAAAAIGIDPGKLLERAERWRPWRAYAAMLLWETLG